jgi:hypothetical protein
LCLASQFIGRGPISLFAHDSPLIRDMRLGDLATFIAVYSIPRFPHA